MRPLPRLLALADDERCRADDFPIKAAAILSVGPSVAIVIRSLAPDAAAHLRRVRSLARPSEGGTFGYADAALASEAGAQGLILPEGADLAAARTAFTGRIGIEVQSLDGARRVAASQIEFLVIGADGPSWLTAAAALGCPVFASADGAAPEALRDAGAYGITITAAVWDSRDPAEAAAALIAGWAE